MLASTSQFPRPVPCGRQRYPGEDGRSLQLSHLIKMKRTTSSQTNHTYVPASTAAKLCSPQSDLIFFRAPGNPFITRHYSELPGAPNPGTRLLEFMPLRAVGPGDRPCPALVLSCSHAAAPIPMVHPSVHPSVRPSIHTALGCHGNEQEATKEQRDTRQRWRSGEAMAQEGQDKEEPICCCLCTRTALPLVQGGADEEISLLEKSKAPSSHV